LEPERWIIVKQAGCNDFVCSYTVKPANGEPFVLRSTGPYTWNGTRRRSADCTHRESPYRLVQRSGYRATDQLTLPVDPANDLRATIEDHAKYSARSIGRRKHCDSGG